jgi:hypothetical protein
LSLTGCGTFLVGDEGVVAPYQATSLEGRVYPGVTSRSDINKLLGTPVASSETWRVELYRTDNEDAYAIWGGMLILPLPIWAETATQAIYALVAYDQEWKVSDFDTGYFVEEIQDAREGMEKDAIAAGFRFELDTFWHELEPGSEWLFAPKAATDAVLSAKPKPESCTIYLANSRVDVRLFLDGDIYLNPRGSMNNYFLAVSAPSGKHEIKVIPTYRPMWSLEYKGAPTIEVVCSAGQRLFIDVKANMIFGKSFFDKNSLTAEFEVRNEPSAFFKACGLVLYHNGKWIGPEKPNSD